VVTDIHLDHGYMTLSTPTEKYGKQLNENNLKAKSTILGSLVDSIYVKVVHCGTAKDLWGKIKKYL
jgi:hypothetical protein